ncbi:MAG: TolC family protein [Myxococcota bacterium]
MLALTSGSLLAARPPSSPQPLPLVAPPTTSKADPEPSDKPAPTGGDAAPVDGPVETTDPAPGPAPETPTPAVSDSDTAPAATAAPPVENLMGLSADYEPPFASEQLELSEVLAQAVVDNMDLRSNAVDIEINEAQVLAALGAYDVFITGEVFGSISETPQRGSAFQFARGARTVQARTGLRKKFQTGGTLDVGLTASRTKTDQPINPFDAGSGVTTLSTYTLIPQLTLTHPLLRGAGLRINRADINRAKIATSSAEAAQQITAQNLVRDIVTSYWDLLFAHRDLENKRRSVELAQKQLERTRALVSAGRLSPVDAKAVEQSVAVRESDVITAEGALLDASLNLRTLAGQQFADRDTLGVLPMTDPVVKPRVVDTKGEMERALANNPQVRQLQLAIASRRIDELVAANNRLPQLDISGSFTPQGRSVDTIPDQTTGDPGGQGNWGEAFRNIFSDQVAGNGLLADWTLTGTLTLTWDVQNRGPKGQHQAALKQIEKSRLQLDQARQNIASGVIRAANSLRTAAKVMEVSEISLDLAADNLAAEQARFDVGRSTNFDVLQRIDEVDSASANALSAQVAYLKALVQLQSLNGEILPAYGLDLE